MESNNVSCGIHYPKLISNQIFIKNHKQYRKYFKNASKFEKNIISLPIFPGMTIEQASYVCKSLNSAT
jgi:dTDP-4-amino-4,6-dideoxygalactose transaminase